MSNFQSFFFECASEFRSICGLFLANQLMEWKWLDFQVKTPILMRLSAVCVMCFSRYFFIVMKIEPFFRTVADDDLYIWKTDMFIWLQHTFLSLTINGAYGRPFASQHLPESQTDVENQRYEMLAFQMAWEKGDV